MLTSIIHSQPKFVVADTIVLVADDWCPYNCAADAKDPGFLIELARLIFTARGHTVEYKVLPWSRAIEESRSGKFTGIVGAYKDDAPDFIYPEESVVRGGNDFFVKSGDPWKYDGLSSLEKVSIGVIQDYSYGAELNAYIKRYSTNADRIQVVSGDDALEKNINKLLAGRIRVVLEDASVMNHFLQAHGNTKEVISAGGGEKQNVYIAFSPAIHKAKDYANLLSEGIIAHRKDGTLQTILGKYGVRSEQ